MSKVMKYEDAVDLALDPLSCLTMLYTQEGFEELQKDIEQQGQLIPIALRNGKILDGRHRHKACMALGIDVRYEELGNISEAAALDYVISRSINKATGTDASKVEAYLMCKAKGMRLKDMPSVFKRLNANSTKKLAAIEREDPRYLQVLLNQNKVRLYNKTFDKIENYGTIHGIWQVLRSNKAMEDKLIEVSPTQDEAPSYDIDIANVMINKAAENTYWELYYLGKESGTNLHPNTPCGKKIIELINKLHKNTRQ